MSAYIKSKLLTIEWMYNLTDSYRYIVKFLREKIGS